MGQRLGKAEDVNQYFVWGIIALKETLVSHSTCIENRCYLQGPPTPT